MSHVIFLLISQYRGEKMVQHWSHVYIFGGVAVFCRHHSFSLPFFLLGHVSKWNWDEQYFRTLVSDIKPLITKSAAQYRKRDVQSCEARSTLSWGLLTADCGNTDFSCSRSRYGLFTGRGGWAGRTVTLNHFVILKYARPQWPWIHTCWQM